jgi:hypothetical protein
MNSEIENRMIKCLDEKLKPYSFEGTNLSSSSPSLPLLAGWKRKTWNTNRAIAVISLPEFDGQPGEFAQTLKMPLGKIFGYFPFFYPLGLQIVLIGNSLLNKTDNLEKSVDKLDNQRVVLQSIHVVDLEFMKSVSVRTWGQYETGRFQDAIESGIQTFLANSKTD